MFATVRNCSDCGFSHPVSDQVVAVPRLSEAAGRCSRDGRWEMVLLGSRGSSQNGDREVRKFVDIMSMIDDRYDDDPC